jgi:hypothetical protein
MHVTPVAGLLACRVLLSSEPDKSFSEQVDLKGLVARYQGVYSKVVFETVNQMRIANILRDNVAGLTFDFLFLSDNFDSATTTKGVGFHNIHVLVAVCFTLGCEFAEVIREEVSAGTEVELLGEEALHSRAILPHQVLAADLE